MCHYFIEDMPPSTASTCPVIQEDLSESKKAARFATSSVVPILFSGCLFAFASFFASLLSNDELKGVSVIEGAIQLTRIDGANSAANALVKPSMAPFEEATME